MDRKNEENARVQRILGSQDGKASILPLKSGGRASKDNCYADGGMVGDTLQGRKVDQKRPTSTTVNVIVAPKGQAAESGDQGPMNPNAMKAALAQAAATRPPQAGMPVGGPALPQWAQNLGAPGHGGPGSGMAPMPMYTGGAASGVGRLEKIKEYGSK